MQRLGSRQLGPSRLTKGSSPKVTQELFDVLASAVDQLSQSLLEHLWVQAACHPGRVGCIEKLDGQTVVVKGGRPRPHLLVRADDRSPAGDSACPGRRRSCPTTTLENRQARPGWRAPAANRQRDPSSLRARAPCSWARRKYARATAGAVGCSSHGRLPLRLGRSISEALRAAWSDVPSSTRQMSAFAVKCLLRP
jgi:hypothetical protein